jgi:indolepyruvate ferredoxin oxidoreductase
LLPLSLESLQEAIRLNGAAVDNNLRAFKIGRWAALYPEEAAKVLQPNVISLPKTLDDKIAFRMAHLTAYHSKRMAKRYARLLDGIEDPKVKAAAADGYHKVLAYKDEYEVARLLLKSRAKAETAFEGDLKMTFHLAPPMLSKQGPDGRPMKREFGPWLERPLRLMAKFKGLRGTPFDPFGYTAERKMERALIKQYEADMRDVLPKLTDQTRDAIVALAELPLQIRGFGPVKHANEAKAAKRREELLSVIRAGGPALAKAAE